MTQDIIEMARQVYGDTVWSEASLDRLKRFYNLVATKATEEANARANASWTWMCKKMVDIEREACAKVFDAMADQMVEDMEPSTAVDWVRRKATEIRARGEQA